MNKKKYIVLVGVILIGILFLIFYYKNLDSGNNIISNSNAKEYILNMKSYRAIVTVEVKNNKNSNQYVMKQEYRQPNWNCQEVIQPENIKGLKITYDGTSFKLENTAQNLSQVYDKYSYVTNNSLFLNDFIERYKKDEKAICREEKQEMILEVKSEENEYRYQKLLYIDKNTKKPTKMEIKNITQNTLVYILYNEIEINHV